VTTSTTNRRHERWANLRHQIIGTLLAAPPKRGELREALEALAARSWHHPITGEPVQFGFSTLERWLHIARKAAGHGDTVGALRRKLRSDAGRRRTVSSAVVTAVTAQHKDHPTWSYQLHADNLVAQVELGELTDTRVPSYSTVKRVMKERGLFRQKRRQRRGNEEVGKDHSREIFESRETRSFESEYVHGLWHLDFHGAKYVRIVLPSGELATPKLLGILDDRSRLCCHAQWYVGETGEALVHGLAQAIQKRGLPQQLMTDNGSAMKDAEVREGLARLGIRHERTLPGCPEQNGKQEAWWDEVEGRPLAMLERVEDLTLDVLNHATQAWIEMEYNRARHSEIRETPSERYLRGPDVGRPSPSADELRFAFRVEERRTQRRSDGTVTIAGVRYELPSRYRTLERPSVRYASWDLSMVHLVDERTGTLLARLYPLDRTKNGTQSRRQLAEIASPTTPAPPTRTSAATHPKVAPLLRQLITAYDRSGLPPAYVPKA
jgi:transposase InsO family protein